MLRDGGCAEGGAGGQRELPGVRGNRARREARALFANRGERGTTIRLRLLHPLHHAVVLAVTTAAGRKTGFRIGGKQRRYQHRAENEHQQKCDSAAHDFGRV